ncbi:MAG: DNA-binding NtrC family response regulator [Candidatus Endobugula sp.]|jgi:DNA-binding NtrC family response regulator
MHRILIVEDESIIRMALRKLLERHDYHVSEAESVQEATRSYDITHFDLIISDLRLPGAPGTELITLATQASTKTPVLIMTSYASLRSAVDAMRMGAVDYIAKPFDHDEMIKTVERILNEPSGNAVTPSAKDASSTNGDKQMIGSSPIMLNLYHQIQKVAPTNATILIEGETGTGKELVARSIHSSSTRASKQLISINCAAIPETLIESELFGHEKGAFTGASSQRDGLIVSADGGSLFLDEIGELPLEAQARLLRVLQEGEVRPVGSTKTQKVNVRLLAATHRNLQTRCQEGSFREDLFFRLNVINLQIPPLRERGDDIITLAESLIIHYCEVNNKSPLRLSIRAKQLISKHPWPGNVRELENTMQRAVILCENTEEIGADLLDLTADLSAALLKRNVNAHHSTSTPANRSSANQHNYHSPLKNEDLSLEDYFQRIVLENQDSMNETELSKKLGISRKCLWERRQKLGIPRKK